MSWENRIVGTGNETPDQLLANPYNFRLHPKVQQDALESVLDRVGWVQDVIVNRTTGHILDGHLRVELALRAGEEVPVKYIEVNEDEEHLLLATFDPISAMAQVDDATHADLLEQIDIDDPALAALLNTDAEGDDELKLSAPEAREKLSDRLLVPPFTVLDARQGYWTQRKALWLALGIKSELGRGQDGDRGAASGLTYSVSSQPASVHNRKREIEERDGTQYTWAEFADKYPDEITLSGDSVFDPVLTEISYRWFAPDGGRILDPFAGGSVRGIVAAILGFEYTGIELRPEQVQANRANWQHINGVAGRKGDQIPAWITGDSTEADKLLPPDYQADLVFSCPPYADLEVYSDDARDISNMDYDQFIPVYREIIAKACARLKNNRFAVWIVGEVRDKRGAYRDFVGDTIQAFRDAGLDYYNEAILITPTGSLSMRAGNYWRASRKLGKGHQNVLIFRKGETDKKALDDVAEFMTAWFEQHRDLLKQHEKVLVFAKGDPKAAADELGPAITGDDLPDIDG